MLALLVPSFEGSIVERFAREGVSSLAPPLLAPKTPALNPCISITCNLIENKRLYPLYSQHLQKTGGGGIYRSLGQTTPATPFLSHNSNSRNHNSFPLINLQKQRGIPTRTGPTILRAVRPTLFASSAHGTRITGHILRTPEVPAKAGHAPIFFPCPPLATRHSPLSVHTNSR